jgi:hypothetical protein
MTPRRPVTPVAKIRRAGFGVIRARTSFGSGLRLLRAMAAA